MMEFVLSTLSFTVAILLASFVSVMVCTSKVVLKWYMKKVNTMTEVMFSNLEEEES